MTITFVLLVATGRDIDTCTNILIPSIIHFFNLNDLEELIIVVKDINKPLLNLKLPKMVGLKYKIITDSELITNKTKKTYYLQMYLKLLICNRINTVFYLTLDADVFFCKQANINHLITNTLANYIKIIKRDIWLDRSNEFLNYHTDHSINQTPFIFKTDLVKQLLDNINVKEAILNYNCSEYTLYLTFLKKNNLFNKHYQSKIFKNVTFSKTHITYPTNYLIKILDNQFKTNNDKVLGCIQSRTKLLNKLLPIIKKYIPISFNKPKIAMLTVISDDIYYKRYQKAIKIKRDYCHYYNYDFIFKRFNKCNGWNKILILKQKLKDYDYIFTSDADVILTNRDIRIEDIILRYSLNKSILGITTDYNSLNSGNIIWRNCYLSRQLIKKTIELNDDKIRYSLKTPFIPKGIYEQPSLIYWINSNKKYQEKIKIIPQFEMNSYESIFPELRKPNIIKSINKINNRCNWKEGDFLIHLAGFNYIIKNNFKINCYSIIDKYQKIYYKLIKQKEGDDFGYIL